MRAQAHVVETVGAPFVLEEIEVDDDLRADEVLVRMRATGVCHTDLWVRHQPKPDQFPAVFGHEGAGIVERIGAHVKTVRPGDSVVMSHSNCGDCKNCRAKETSFCSTWEIRNFGVGRLDGSKAYSKNGQRVTSHFFGQSTFSSLAIVMETSVVKVPSSIPLDILAPLGCGIMTGAGALLNLVKVTEGCSIVITGAGAVGLAALMAVKLQPVKPGKVICVDLLPQRLEMALQFGATDVINSKDSPNLTVSLMALTDGVGVDASIDTTGRPGLIRELLDATANKGMVISIGVGQFTAEVSTNIFRTVNTGRTYVGCCMGNCYPQEFIPMLIAKWQEGQFPFDKLIGKYSSRDMEKAADDVLSGKIVKAVLVWDT